MQYNFSKPLNTTFVGDRNGDIPGTTNKQTKAPGPENATLVTRQTRVCFALKHTLHFIISCPQCLPMNQVRKMSIQLDFFLQPTAWVQEDKFKALSQSLHLTEPEVCRQAKPQMRYWLCISASRSYKRLNLNQKWHLGNGDESYRITVSHVQSLWNVYVRRPSARRGLLGGCRRRCMAEWPWPIMSCRLWVCSTDVLTSASSWMPHSWTDLVFWSRFHSTLWDRSLCLYYSRGWWTR